MTIQTATPGSPGQLIELVRAIEDLGPVAVILILLVGTSFIAIGGMFFILWKVGVPLIQSLVEAMKQNAETNDALRKVAESSAKAISANERSSRVLTRRTVKTMNAVHDQLTSITNESAKARIKLRDDVMRIIEDHNREVSEKFTALETGLTAVKQTLERLKLSDINTQLDQLVETTGALKKLITLAIPTDPPSGTIEVNIHTDTPAIVPDKPKEPDHEKPKDSPPNPDPADSRPADGSVL